MISCLQNSGRILLRLTPAGSACARQHRVTRSHGFRGDCKKFRFSV